MVLEKKLRVSIEGKETEMEEKVMSTKSVFDVIDEKLKGFGSAERSFQLSVKLKPEYGKFVEKVKSMLGEQLDAKRQLGKGAEASKADAVEFICDVAEAAMKARGQES